MTNAIEVRDLAKTFMRKRKGVGVRQSFRSLVRPTVDRVEAVRGISFAMGEGEILGLIGPNGAGKSTTIKMLTGTLHPTSGDASVLGHTPWRERKQLSYQIGTVFGQRAQLWYHLPALDTFVLFGKLYEVESRELRRRVAELADTFDVAHLLHTPIRKLSLGERMRCEIISSLIHRPRLLLLDEPSVGLDVVAKQRIRDTVKQLSETDGLSVLITSHDPGDIEALCRRVLIIDHGSIVYDDTVELLKRSYLNEKYINVHFAEDLPDDFNVAGTSVVGRGPYEATLRFDTRTVEVDRVLARLSDFGRIVDVTVNGPSLEETISAVFESGRKARTTVV